MKKSFNYSMQLSFTSKRRWVSNESLKKYITMMLKVAKVSVKEVNVQEVE